MTTMLDITPAEYLNDPGGPTLSASMAHTLLTRSPAHAWAYHPLLGNQAPFSTKAQDDGSIIHSLLLGRGQEIVVLDAADFRTKAAREARDQAYAEGKIPICEPKYGPIAGAADKLKAGLAAFGIDLAKGQSEVCLQFEENGKRGSVRCRCMIDSVRWDDHVLFDVKKITSADLRTCSRHAYFYGYDIQHAAYTSGYTKFAEVDECDFVFLFLELDPPYAVTPLRPSNGLRQLGEMRWLRAVELWERCLTENQWPSYVDSIGTLDALDWALAQEEIEYDDSI